MQTVFYVPVDGKLVFIPFEDVLFVSAKDKYCEIVTVKKKFLANVTMNFMEEKLPQNLFVRIHRSHIVAVNKINCLDYPVLEIGEYKIDISKRGIKALSERTLGICPDLEKKIKREMNGLGVEEYLKTVKDRRSE